MGDQGGMKGLYAVPILIKKKGRRSPVDACAPAPDCTLASLSIPQSNICFFSGLFVVITRCIDRKIGQIHVFG